MLIVFIQIIEWILKKYKLEKQSKIYKEKTSEFRTDSVFLIYLFNCIKTILHEVQRCDDFFQFRYLFNNFTMSILKIMANLLIQNSLIKLLKLHFSLNLLEIRAFLYATQTMVFFLVLIMSSYALIMDRCIFHPQLLSLKVLFDFLFFLSCFLYIFHIPLFHILEGVT